MGLWGAYGACRGCIGLVGLARLYGELMKPIQTPNRLARANPYNLAKQLFDLPLNSPLPPKLSFSSPLAHPFVDGF